MADFIKWFFLSVRIKSMQVGFIDLYYAGESMRLSRSELDIKFFKLRLYVDILKSPTKTKCSYIGLKKFEVRYNSLVMRDHSERGVYNFTYTKSPPPFLVLSLRYILKPPANWESGNESSISASDSRNISVLFRTVSWMIDNLFLMEIYLYWGGLWSRFWVR